MTTMPSMPMPMPPAQPEASSGMTIHNPLAAPTQVGMQLGLSMLPNGKQQVVMILLSSAATLKADLDPDEADQWADMLKQAARQARSGLIVPNAQVAQQLQHANGNGAAKS